MQRDEIYLDLWVDHIAFSDTRLVQVHKETQSCPVLSTVYRLIHNEYPATCRHTPTIVHKYWDLRGELISNNGLLPWESHSCMSYTKNMKALQRASSQLEHWSNGTPFKKTLQTLSRSAWHTSGYQLHFQQSPYSNTFHRVSGKNGCWFYGLG